MVGIHRHLKKTRISLLGMCKGGNHTRNHMEQQQPTPRKVHLEAERERARRAIREVIDGFDSVEKTTFPPRRPLGRVKKSVPAAPLWDALMKL